MVMNSEKPSETTRRLPAEQRRALIEESAARLFAERGFTASTMDEIAAAAGVSKPMVYRHFESKRDLQLRLMERRRDELAAAPLQEYVSSQASPAERAPAMIDAWFAHVEEHPDSCRMLFQDALDDPEVRALQLELRRRQRAADVALLRELGPSLPEAQLEPLGEIMRSALSGLALWWLERPQTPRALVVAAFLRVTRGLLATAPGEPAGARHRGA